MNTLLSDIKVLDLTHGIVGPFCTKLLADYGAEVTKIERPDGGDISRKMGPFPNDIPHPECSGLFLTLNTNKKSISLNLKTTTGREIAYRLIREADIIVESFRPGIMRALGLPYNHLSQMNPSIIMVSISNFGQTGPYRNYRTTELISYAMGSSMHSTGVPDREPLKMGGTATLFQAGNTAAVAAIGALYNSKCRGVGEHVDYSIMEGQVSSIDRNGPSLMAMAYSGEPSFRRTFMRRVTISPYGAYPCADGYAHFTSPQQAWWDNFCRIIEHPELSNDPRYQGENFNDIDLAPEIDEAFLPWILTQTKRDVMSKCHDIAGSPINTMEDLFNDPHFRERNFFKSIGHPIAGTLEYPGPPVRPSKTPWKGFRAPLLGEHNEDVLCRQLGYSKSDMVQLSQSSVI